MVFCLPVDNASVWSLRETFRTNIRSRIELSTRNASATSFAPCTRYASERARLRMHEYRTNKIRAFDVYKIADERVIPCGVARESPLDETAYAHANSSCAGAGYRMQEKKSDAFFCDVYDESSVTLILLVHCSLFPGSSP